MHITGVVMKGEKASRPPFVSFHRLFLLLAIVLMCFGQAYIPLGSGTSYTLFRFQLPWREGCYDIAIPDLQGLACCSWGH